MRPETKEHASPDPSVFERSNAGRRSRPDATDVVIAHRRRVALVAVALGGMLLLAMVAVVREILIRFLADAAAWFWAAQRP